MMYQDIYDCICQNTKKKYTIHYVIPTAQLLFKNRFPKGGPTCRKQVINPRSLYFVPYANSILGYTNVYGQHKDSPIVVGNLKAGYQYTVMVCRVNGNAQSPDWSVKNVCAIQFCKIGSGATVVIMTHLNIKR